MRTKQRTFWDVWLVGQVMRPTTRRTTRARTAKGVDAMSRLWLKVADACFRGEVTSGWVEWMAVCFQGWIRSRVYARRAE